MDKQRLQELLHNDNIAILDLLTHGKASEAYVEVCFRQEDGFEWHTFVPYQNRRQGMQLRSEVELAAYLKSIKRFFAKDAIEQWIKKEKARWMGSKAAVTKGFFESMLTLKPVTEFPESNNPARRIQDIKDAGYTVATLTKFQGGKTARVLLPLPLASEMGYETFTPQFKARVIRLLKGINAYEAKPTPKAGLIPDHKFAEVRWDSQTKGENLMSMSDDEVVAKFQLLDNQRNQQKREVCRRCFQEGVRGVIYGIPYFYEGNEIWAPDIPMTGKEAEAGCIGCGWYDIEEWRRRLIEKLNSES